MNSLKCLVLVFVFALVACGTAPTFEGEVVAVTSEGTFDMFVSPAAVLGGDVIGGSCESANSGAVARVESDTETISVFAFDWTGFRPLVTLSLSSGSVYEGECSFSRSGTDGELTAAFRDCELTGSRDTALLDTSFTFLGCE